jgi:hypothetical protein
MHVLNELGSETAFIKRGGDVAALMVFSLLRVVSLSFIVMVSIPEFVIPGWSAGPDPESRGSPMCERTS